LRLIVGLLVALVASTALLVAVVLWRISPKPYDLADGQQLHEVLSGRWDWTTNERPCTGNEHTIAFSDSGQVMAITLAEIDSTTGTPDVAVYDIVREGPSSIMGAIRNETRLTEDGKPVVWELILISPDRYVWRRTDWGRWNSTAPIIRCR
jgi:hypothetical protein